MPTPGLPNPGTLDSLGLLFTLLPGLLTYLVVHFTSNRGARLYASDAILKGLALTLLVHAIWYLLKSLGSLIPTPDLVGLCITSLGLGIAISALLSSGHVFTLLRRLGITTEASWVTVWETAFREFRALALGEYVVLHLRDGRRTMGAIRGFSRHHENGHICLERVRWFSHTTESEEHPGLHLFAAKDVFVVEFLPTTKGTSNARGNTNPTTGTS